MAETYEYIENLYPGLVSPNTFEEIQGQIREILEIIKTKIAERTLDPRNADALVNEIYKLSMLVYEGINMDELEENDVVLGRQMECVKFARLCEYIIERLNEENKSNNYKLTDSKDYENLKETEIAVLKLQPFATSYHFIVMVSLNKTYFKIYSYYGKYPIRPFTILKTTFKTNYTKLMDKTVTTTYNRDITSTEIYKVWKSLTHVSLKNIFYEYFKYDLLSDKINEKYDDGEIKKEQYEADLEQLKEDFSRISKENDIPDNEYFTSEFNYGDDEDDEKKEIIIYWEGFIDDFTRQRIKEEPSYIKIYKYEGPLREQSAAQLEIGGKRRKRTTKKKKSKKRHTKKRNTKKKKYKN
jgi:hypothetical protein